MENAAALRRTSARQREAPNTLNSSIKKRGTSKGKALSAVHVEGGWLVDRESGKAIDRLLHEHGLMLQLSDGSSRNTLLGAEADVDLLMCFLGIWDEWEIPNILHMRGYIDLEECEEIYERLESDEAEQVLRPLVQKVWRLFCNPSGVGPPRLLCGWS